MCKIQDLLVAGKSINGIDIDVLKDDDDEEEASGTCTRCTPPSCCVSSFCNDLYLFMFILLAARIAT
jgi:hypothetical protein